MEYSNISELLALDSSSLSRVISKLPFKNGAYCIFIQLDDRVGIKLYLNLFRRNYNYDAQLRAAKENLGPEVYGKIDKVKYNGKIFYGYYSELVEVINWKIKTSKEKSAFYGKYSKKIEELRDSIEKTGFNFSDLHGGNLGIKNGKLIVIDFDKPQTNYGIKDELNMKDNF